MKIEIGHEWEPHDQWGAPDEPFEHAIYKCLKCRVYARRHKRGIITPPSGIWNIAFSKNGTNILDIEPNADCVYIRENRNELMKQINFKELLK